MRVVTLILLSIFSTSCGRQSALSVEAASLPPMETHLQPQGAGGAVEGGGLPVFDPVEPVPTPRPTGSPLPQISPAPPETPSPTCSFELEGVSSAFVKFRFGIFGFVTAASINGVSIGVSREPAQAFFMEWTLDPLSLHRALEGAVQGSGGRIGNCSVALPREELRLDLSAWIDYFYRSGSTLSAPLLVAGHGAGNSFGVWSILARASNVPIVSAEKKERSRYCESDEVMVGVSGAPDNAFGNPICAPLLPTLKVTSESSLTFDWWYGARLACPGGSLMAGLEFLPQGRNGVAVIRCATIDWK